jgi:hypothetical protein
MDGRRGTRWRRRRAPHRRALFAVTASNNHIAWFLWFTIAGSLLPGFMLLFLGMKQKRAVLEVISK